VGTTDAGVEGRHGSEPGSRRRPGPTHGVLVRYRVMAYVTAVLLIVLVFVGVPLQVVAGRPVVVNVVGTMHGFLYIVYLVVAFDLTRRLRVPWWQMALVLLAGTVPFCAFVAERKMTRRFDEATRGDRSAGEQQVDRKLRSAAMRRRWFSRRALLLHLEVAFVAPACAAAGWWQATRALAGNSLSWVYSVEWPIFALLALAGWWHLVHEDPEAYRARRRPVPDDPPGDEVAAALSPAATGPLARRVVRASNLLAAGVGLNVVVGLVCLAVIPFGRPSGWIPPHWAALYLVHASLGALLAAGATAMLTTVRGSERAVRAAAWAGAVSVAVAGTGGLLTEVQSLGRFLGIALMFIGSVLGGCAYLAPALLAARARAVAGAAASTDRPAVS
jgi:integral membrane protein